MLARPTLDLLHTLGLHGMAKGYQEIDANPEARALEHAEWLGLLLEHEVTLRRQKRFETRARAARLRHPASIEDVDYHAHRGLDRATFLKLAACNWIHATVFADAGPPPAVVGGLLIGASAVTAILGGVLAFLQRHLKRLLAFSTVSHMGIALVGIGLLGPQGLAGAALYLVGHGLIKGALFMCAGVLLALRGAIDEGELRGRGRGLPWTGLLFATGGLALAGLPGEVGHTGKSLVEHELQSAGLGWLTVLLSIASILTGAAVLRAAGRIFLGLGPAVAEQGPSEHEDEKPGRPGAFMFGPPLVLIGAAVALAWLPRLTPAVIEQAAWFGNGDAIAARLLDGIAWTPPPAPSEPELSGPVPGLAAAFVAVLIAAAALRPHTLPGRLVRHLEAAWLPRRLQDLHSGHVGDYTAWLVLGAAAMGAFLAWFGTAS